jgi:hypothetical protein
VLFGFSVQKKEVFENTQKIGMTNLVISSQTQNYSFFRLKSYFTPKKGILFPKTARVQAYFQF